MQKDEGVYPGWTLADTMIRGLSILNGLSPYKNIPSTFA